MQENKITQKTNLTEKQSARTTFRLNKITVETIEWFLTTNNIKPKELFDIIVSNKKLINTIAENISRTGEESETHGVRKTFVISKGTLRMLNRISDKNKITRDKLVNLLILLFKEILMKQQENEEIAYEKASTIINDFWMHAEKVENELKNIVDEDDALIDRFGMVVILIHNLSLAISSKLNNGIPVDPDDISQTN